MISVVIPYYNHEDSLIATLRSISAQTGVQTEVILVDDGSEQLYDQSIAKQIFPDIICATHTENHGAPAARNTGLSHATGEYIIFWDADVIASADMLEQMQSLLEDNSEIGFVYSSFVFGPKTFVGQPFSLGVLKERNYIHSTTLIRKDIAQDWDESLNKFQDWDYWLTLASSGIKGRFIDAVLFKVGQRKEGMSRWLPRIAYYKPFCWLPGIRSQVVKYNNAKTIIQKKHKL